MVASILRQLELYSTLQDTLSLQHNRVKEIFNNFELPENRSMQNTKWQ